MAQVPLPLPLLGLGFPNKQMSSLNLGFLPRLGGQAFQLASSCSQEEVFVPRQELAWLSGGSQSNPYHSLLPASEELALWSGGRWSCWYHATGARMVVGWRTPRAHFQSSSASYLTGASQSCCAKTGLGCQPHLAGICSTYLYPFVQINKLKLQERQRLLGQWM